MAVTPSDVKNITGSELADEVVQPFINAAACVMSQISECTALLTTECVEQITIYLAAHLLTTSAVGQGDGVVTKESLRGKYSVEYLTPKAQGDGVMGTTYGQTANMMTGGCLAEIGKRPVSFNSIGCI